MLVGEPTYRLVRDAVEVEAVEPLELKGKAERVPAYRLISVRDGVEAMVRDRDAALVGHETRAGAAGGRVRPTRRRGRAGSSRVLGQAGLGKSRLVEECRPVRGRRATLRGRCLPYGDGITFWPLVEVVRAGGGDHRRGSRRDARAKRIEHSLPGVRDVLARVASAVGFSAEASRSRSCSGRAARAARAACARTAPRRRVRGYPLGGADVLDLVEEPRRGVRGAPLLLLCDSRPDLLETRPGWRGEARCPAGFRLEPLTAAEERARDREHAR